MTDHEQDPRLRDLARTAAPGLVDDVTAAILSGLHTNPLLAAGLGGFIGLAVALDQATGQRRADRLAKVLEDVSDDLGGPDVLAERALATDETAELTRRILEAAAHTTLPEKLRALGRVLAQALDGTETVDTALLIAGALQDIEAPHIRALRIIEYKGTLRSTLPAMAGRVPGISVGDIRTNLRGEDGALEAVVGTLMLHGLVRDITAGAGGYGMGGARYTLTDLAGQILDLLTDHAPSD